MSTPPRPAIDAALIADAHRRYAAERDALVPDDHAGPRPSGGVGGTRTGVKCLHAHYAWHLAGGDDPVGRWVATQLDAAATRFASRSATSARRRSPPTADAAGSSVPTAPTHPVGRRQPHRDRVRRPRSASPGAAHQRPRRRRRPVRRRRARATPSSIDIGGGDVQRARWRPRWPALEVGGDDVARTVRPRTRDAAEEIFRTRRHRVRSRSGPQPGTTAASTSTRSSRPCCIVLAVMRRFHLEQVSCIATEATGCDIRHARSAVGTDPRCTGGG